MDQRVLDSLIRRLTRVGFTNWHLIDETKLIHGDCFAFAVIWRGIFEAFPRFVLQFMVNESWFCLESDDGQLAAAALKFMKCAFAYQPALSPGQVVQNKYFAAKAQICLDAIALLEREERRAATPSTSLVRRNPSYSCRHERLEPELTPVEVRLAQLSIRRRQLNRAVREPLALD